MARINQAVDESTSWPRPGFAPYVFVRHCTGIDLSNICPRTGLATMRSVKEYLANAAECDRRAAAADHDSERKRYEDLAACYRLLAAERERLIREGALPASPDNCPQHLPDERCRSAC